MKKYLIPRGFDIKIAIHSAQTLSEGTNRERQNVDKLPEKYKEILGAHTIVCEQKETSRFEIRRVHLPDLGLTFIWNGNGYEVHSTHGDGFMINDEFSETWNDEPPKQISDETKRRLPLSPPRKNIR